MLDSNKAYGALLGAVAGALMGSYDGAESIPKRWLNFKDNDKVKEFAKFAIDQW